MTRWLFALWLLAIGIAAHTLFAVEQEVRLLEEDLSDMEFAILSESDALRALQADWSYLNRPERLAALSKEHLSFLPMRPRQITQFTALPMRLSDKERLALALAAEGVPMPKRKPEMNRLAPAVLTDTPPAGTPVISRATPREAVHTDTVHTDTGGSASASNGPLASNTSDPRFVNPVTGLPLPPPVVGVQP